MMRLIHHLRICDKNTEIVKNLNKLKLHCEIIWLKLFIEYSEEYLEY